MMHDLGEVMTAYNYKDILLQPKYSEVESRSHVDLTCKLGKKTFKLPIVPANMKTVIDETLAFWLAERDLFYVMHRFGVDQLDFCRKMKHRNLYTSISVGVNDDSYRMINDFKFYGIIPDYITIDIAHGHSIKMKHMLSHVKNIFPDSFVIAGNVCTVEGIHALEEWGADAVKLGIGPGHACTTKLKTGFSHPQFSAVLQCAQVAQKPVIADGGIEYPGDIAKALVAGATMVMAGYMFAGHDESPGERKIYPDGRIVKEYFGSASEHNKNEKKYVEGRRLEIPYKGPIQDTYTDIEQSLRSAVSYAGGTNLSAFNTVDWVVVH
jgi:GMP reductase